jgi:hypothetical protein
MPDRYQIVNQIHTGSLKREMYDFDTATVHLQVTILRVSNVLVVYSM